MSSDRLWAVEMPNRRTPMLRPFEFVMAHVANSRYRYGVERFRSLFPIRVRMNPDLYFVVAQNPMTTDGIVMTEDGLLYVAPDPKLRQEEVRIDPRYGQA